MTNSIHKEVLPICAAQIAVLETTGKQMNKAVGEMQTEFRQMRESTQEHKIYLATLNTNMEKLSNTLSVLNTTLDKKIDNKIDDALNKHENNCVFYQVAKKKTESDITKKFKTPSLPPKEDVDKEIGKAVRTLPKKIKTAIWFGLGLATVITTIIGIINAS